MASGTAARAEPAERCRKACGASASRNGNSNVVATAGRAVPSSTIVRSVGGAIEVASEGGSRGRARSTCPGCRYTSEPLIGPGAAGGLSGAPFLGCAGANFARTRLVYRTAPGQSGRTLVGVACPGTPTAPEDAEPVITLEMIEGEVRRLTEQVAPPAPELGFAPAGTGIVNIPVLVWATPQQTIRRDFAPFGIPVAVTLTPSWEWTFESGATTTTAHPGQPYRDNGVPVARDAGYVTRAYRTPGSRSVTVTVHWAATWSLDGGAPRSLGGTAGRVALGRRRLAGPGRVRRRRRRGDGAARGMGPGPTPPAGQPVPVTRGGTTRACRSGHDRAVRTSAPTTEPGRTWSSITPPGRLQVLVRPRAPGGGGGPRRRRRSPPGCCVRRPSPPVRCRWRSAPSGRCRAV